MIASLDSRTSRSVRSSGASCAKRSTRLRAPSSRSTTPRSNFRYSRLPSALRLQPRRQRRRRHLHHRQLRLHARDEALLLPAGGTMLPLKKIPSSVARDFRAGRCSGLPLCCVIAFCVFHSPFGPRKGGGPTHFLSAWWIRLVRRVGRSRGFFPCPLHALVLRVPGPTRCAPGCACGWGSRKAELNRRRIRLNPPAPTTTPSSPPAPGVPAAPPAPCAPPGAPQPRPAPRSRRAPP